MLFVPQDSYKIESSQKKYKIDTVLLDEECECGVADNVVH